MPVWYAKLEYRSLRFEEEYISDPGGFYQEAMVVNYATDVAPLYRGMQTYQSEVSCLEALTRKNILPPVTLLQYQTLRKRLYERYAQMASEEGCLLRRQACLYKYFNMTGDLECA